MNIRADSKQPLHFGLAFLFGPGEPVTQADVLRFQQGLSEVDIGILFDVVQRGGGEQHMTTMVRRSPPLQVGIGSPGPDGPPLIQLVITAPRPQGQLSDFAIAAEDIVAVFREQWKSAQQVISRNCTVRSLYPVVGAHAFQYLWEERFHQPGTDLHVFGRPIQGGGVRLVLPQVSNAPDATNVELKIESLLADPSQMYVDTAFQWTHGALIGDLAPTAMLQEVSDFEDGPVQHFLTQQPEIL